MISPVRRRPGTRLAASLVAAGLLASSLAACSDGGSDGSSGKGEEKDGATEQAAANLEPVSFGDEVVYADGTKLYFQGGEKPVDVGLVIGFVYYSTAGMVLEVEPKDPDGPTRGFVIAREDGTITDLSIPEDAYVATDAGSPYLAYVDTVKRDGKVVVVDLLTGKKAATVQVPGKSFPQGQVSIDGDTVWLHDPEYRGAFRIDWRSGKVDKVGRDYLRWVRGDFAVTTGGNEIARESKENEPGVLKVDTGKLLFGGEPWNLSPTGKAAGRDRDDDGEGNTPEGTLSIAPLPSGEAITFPVKYDEGGWLDWAWTADGTKVFWFEGAKLTVCVVASKDCSTTDTKAEFGRVPLTGL